MTNQAFAGQDGRRGDQFRLGLGHPMPNMDLRRVHQSVTPPFGSPTTDGSNVESSEENTAPSRKRIAVACGRCRRRKIRCSGDNGHGDPCTNCRNSGSSPCQFLRVQSHETNLRDAVSRNSSPVFGYNVEISRNLQAGGPTDLLGAIVPCHDPIQPWNPSVDGITFDKNGPTYPGDIATAEASRKPYSWSSSGCCAVGANAPNGLEVSYHSPAIMGAIYSQVQDPRYMASYGASFAFRPIAYFDTGSGAYINSNQPPTLPTFLDQQEIADLESQYGVLGISAHVGNTAGHESRVGASSQSPGNNQFVKNEHVSAVSPYSRPASSPAGSPHSLTPSSSFDNSYTSSPVPAYAAMMNEPQVPQQRPLSRAAEMYTPSSSVGLMPTALMSAGPVQSSEFPPARTSSYVYRDTTAAAAAAASSGRRMSPTEETYGAPQPFISSTRLNEAERNIPGTHL